jgi:hypothetical protein
MKHLLIAFVLSLTSLSESHAQFWAKDNGRFSIGDENAFAKLQVNANSSFSNPGIALLDSSATNTSGGILQFRSINYDDNHFNIQAKIGEFLYGQDSKLDFFWRDNLIMSIEGGSTPDHQLIYNPRNGIFRTGYLNTEPRGEYSVAMGYNNTASGYSSVALGGGSQAIGDNSMAVGGSIASGSNAAAFGLDNYASGPFSLAGGYQSSALELFSIALGDSAVASGVGSHAIGHKTLASGYASTATGSQTDATGLYSFTGGFATQATNTSSIAFGFVSQATGVSSSAFGYNTLAQGENAVAFNSITKALGQNSFTAGFDTKTTGWASSAFGDHTSANSYVSAVFGAYNDTIVTSTPDGWVDDDALFMIGNGLSNTERNNALAIYKDGNLVAKSYYMVNSNPGAIPLPVSGPGTRMMWIPEKSAFRVGTVSNDAWDQTNIGTWSLASGFSAKATQSYDIGMGYFAEATGGNSIAIGSGPKASGSSSVAIGESNIASGNWSLALGSSSVAGGTFSTSMGWHSQASGEISTSMGTASIARAYGSTAIGSYNDSLATSSPTSWVDTDPLFMIGNGTSEATRHNAFTLYKNGNLLAKHPTTVNTDPGTATLPVSGSGTRMMWIPEQSAFRVGTVTGDAWDASNIGPWSFASGMNTIASGNLSTAIGSSAIASGSTCIAIGTGAHASGYQTIALGHNTTASADWAFAAGDGSDATGVSSIALGKDNLASNGHSIALGIQTSATGLGSIAMGNGTEASGLNSTAMGNGTNASGDYSTAMGIGTYAPSDYGLSAGRSTIAKAHNATAIGAYNDTIAGSSATLWVETDPLFYIGNGSTILDRSNAMVVYKNGNTDINGYTRLGEATESAPKIKMKELPLSLTGSNYNSAVNIPHGLTAQKILSVSVMVEYEVGYFAPPEYSSSPNLRYSYYISPTEIVIQNNTPSGDCQICERFTKVLITYKE